MTDIFISYASKDRERLRPLRDALEARGWSVFWDQEIPVGKNWRRNIFENLRAARCVIVVWSSASIESDWVSEEAADALKREVLLPIYIDQVEPPFGFADIQTMNFVGWNGEESSESFHRLVSEVTRILGAPLTSQPEPAVVKPPPAKTPWQRHMLMSIGAVLIIVAVIALWFSLNDPEPTPATDETAASQAPDVTVGGDGIAVGRDFNHSGDIKFGD